MKRITSILLFFVLMIAPLSQTVLLVNFYINQGYIASNLCQYKEIKENDCQGQCVLSEQLKKTEEAGQELPGILRELSGLEWFYSDVSIDYPKIGCISEEFSIFYLEKYCNGAVKEFFHPPCFV